MSPDLRDLLRRVKRLADPTGSLTQRSVAGGIWVGLLNTSDRILQLLMILIVARLIGPTEFGLMGIALVALNGFRRFSKLGLKEALVYNEDENVDHYLNTTLSLNVGRGAAIAVVMLLTAPLVATLLGEPRATNVLRALGFAPLIFGLRNPGVVYFQKDLDFQREFVFKISGAGAQLLVAVVYALISPTVWALVFASLSKRFVQAGMSYIVHPYRPSLSFDLERAKELVGYGKWILGSSVTGFLTEQGDDAVVAWLLGASALGFYQMSYRLATAPNTEVTHVISRVVFPAYSKLQDDIARLRKAFYRTIRVTLFVAIPAGVGILVITPTFVKAFLGPDWLPMVRTMQMLTVLGIGTAFGSMFGEVWKAIGRPDVIAKMHGFQILIIAVLIYPLTTQYGIFGTALTIVIASTLIIRPLSIVVTARLIDASIGRMLRELAFPVAAGVSMGAVVWYTRELLDLGIPVLEFGVLVIVGVISYALAVLLLETQLGWGLWSELQSVRNELA